METLNVFVFQHSGNNNVKENERHKRMLLLLHDADDL